jgi:hypothetical protein
MLSSYGALVAHPHIFSSIKVSLKKKSTHFHPPHAEHEKNYFGHEKIVNMFFPIMVPIMNTTNKTELWVSPVPTTN